MLASGFIKVDYFDGISIPFPDVHDVCFVNAKSPGQFYASVLNVVTIFTIFVDNENVVIFHFRNNDVTNGVATYSIGINLNLTFFWGETESQHTAGVGNNHSCDIRYAYVSITILCYVCRTNVQRAALICKNFKIPLCTYYFS